MKVTNPPKLLKLIYLTIGMLVGMMHIASCGGGSSDNSSDCDFTDTILTGSTYSLEDSNYGWKCDNGTTEAYYVFALDGDTALLNENGGLIHIAVYTTEGCFRITRAWTTSTSVVEQVWDLESYNENTETAIFNQSEPASLTLSCEWTLLP